jgi:Na+/melibiose symporter-like transporter
VFFYGLLGAVRDVVEVSRISASTDKKISTPWKVIIQNQAYQKWLFIQALCGLSASVSATLMLFYISEVIQKPQWNAIYLATYFLCAALSTYGWTLVSDRWGKPLAWCVGIVLSTLFFSSTFFLGAGDHWLFLGVCVLTGLTLGADLVLPPALVADIVGEHHELSGGYFGVWTALNKICLALGSLSLVLWEQLNHIVNMPSSQTLILIYVGVPVLLRTLAAILLYQFSNQRIREEY